MSERSSTSPVDRNRPAGKSGKDVMRHLGGGRANDRCELAEPTVGVMCGTFRRRILYYSLTQEELHVVLLPTLTHEEKLHRLKWPVLQPKLLERKEIGTHHQVKTGSG
jgi:hypothetical protein